MNAIVSRRFTIRAVVVTLILADNAQAAPPCKPSPQQLCFEVLPSDLRKLDKQAPRPGLEQTQRPAAPLPNATHDRRLKLDDDTSFGLGGRGLGIKRSF